MPKSRILVIDDEAPIRDSLKMTLEYEGYEFIGAATGQEGLALAEREAPDLVLLDVKMPGMDGIERGTVLLEVNRQHVESVADYRRIARAARPGDILTLWVYSPDLVQRQLKTIRVEDR